MTILVIFKSKYHGTKVEESQPAYAERIRSAPDDILRVRATTYLKGTLLGLNPAKPT